jgi:hypothetical protein
MDTALTASLIELWIMAAAIAMLRSSRTDVTTPGTAPPLQAPGRLAENGP